MNGPPLVLVKHALPAIDELRPAAEWPLSEEGRAAAKSLAASLREFAPSRLVASPEPKAEETAIAMAEVLGLPVGLDSGLVEHRRPEVDFTTREINEARIAALFDRLSERVFGAESADEAESRFATALTVHRMSAGCLIVVTHGTVISLWVSRRFKLEPMPFWRSLTLPCAVIIDGEAAPRLITA